MTDTIKIADIELGGGTQSRAALDAATVAEYAAAMCDGAQFPPVVIYFDGEKHWLGDGFHRVAGAKEAGLDAVTALIRQGTRRDAVLHSVGANSTHGLKRTNADKRRAVETLLRDEEWGLWADREIARRAGVTPTFVGTIRDELKATVHHLQSSIRKGADGREIDTAGITAAAKAAHWSEKQTNADRFWSEVAHYGFNPATILTELQPGCTRLADLEMTFREAEAALQRLAEARLAIDFPIGTWVLNPRSGYCGKVESHHGMNLRIDDPHPEHYVYYWSPADARVATEDEIAAYQEAVKAALAERRQTNSARAERLARFDDDDPVKAMDWRSRYTALAERLSTKKKKPLLVVTTYQGCLLLGDYAIAGAAKLGVEAVDVDGVPTLAATGHEYQLTEKFPGHAISYYEDNTLALLRLQAALLRPKAKILPGDLIRDVDGVAGIILYITGTQHRCRMATFEAGHYEDRTLGAKELTLVESWDPSGEPLDPGVRTPLPLPPLPWTLHYSGVKDANGKTIFSTWAGNVTMKHLLQRTVDTVNCPASAYTGDADLAAALDRVGRLTDADDPQAYDELESDLALLDAWIDGIRSRLKVKRHDRVRA